jgi:eukaryotic-like serine/threonine-protein kinase
MDTADPKFDALLRQVAKVPGESTPGYNRLTSGATLLAGRFTIVRTLGEGGMGIVYEALDAEKRCRVALKTLPKVDPTGLYRFKNEFRLLAEVEHPNLIRLHDLVADGGLWFFTMELIEGEVFSSWVRPDGRLDEGRLRSATHQLCEGLAAAHRRGCLHRDLKPSNILVSRDARVRVLDFGLAIERESGGVGQTVSTHAIMGTPDYMAPEQASGLPATAASDCYAVGVVLFEALVGRRPFQGRAGEVLASKQRDEPPGVTLFAQEAPPDLAALCDELLRRQPERRPTLDAVLQRLGPPSSDRSVDPGLATRKLIGREPELRALKDAYDETLSGKPVVVTLHGESGIGKSSLCEAFLDTLRSDGAAVLLAGQCRERETVPFKALDTLIDELSRYLRRLPTDQGAALLPREVFALATLFPVLARVEAIAAMPGRAQCGAQELRRLAFTALGELFSRLRDQQPLVVCIDDLQWIDADSVALLRHWLVDRAPPSCLLVLIHREEGAHNELLAEVLDAAASNPQLQRRELSLGPLALSDTERLAMVMLGREEPAARGLCAGIARESAGIPFWTVELARFVAASAVDQTVGEAPSLSSALLTRIKLFSIPAQTALELLALVGRPIPLDLLLEASGSSTDDIDALRTAHLVRARRHGGALLLECYHDRIREIVSISLSDERRVKHYEVFASLLIARDGLNPELISTCLERIGDRRRAADYAVCAATEATVALAFDRAASLYTRAIALWHSEGPEKRDLLVKLGTALEHAGRGQEAAAAYRQAAASSDADQEVDLRRRAAEQLLSTGQLDDGLLLLREVCRDVGCRAVWNERSALLSYVWNRCRMHFAAFGRSPRVERPNGRERLRLQTSKTLVTGLIGYLPVQTASNASRYLLMALECGERSDWIRALGFQAHIQTLIEPSAPFASRLLKRMEELADESDSPTDAGFASLMRGTTAYNGGRYRIARQHLASALRTLRGCSGVDWEIDCANIYDQLSASDSGDYADIARNTPALIEEALRRGRLWAAGMLSGFGVHAWLTPDDAPGYSIVLAEAKKQWRGAAAPHWPDFVMLVGESQQLMYSGKPAEAFELFEGEFGRYAKSGIMRSGGRGIGGFAAHHGRAAAAALRICITEPRRLSRIKAVLHSSIRVLRSREGAKRKGIAGTLEAALLCAKGSAREAHSVLVTAADTLDAGGVGMLAAAARRRAGQLLDGPRGREMIEMGEAFMRSQGTRNIEAMTEVSCPGCLL